MKKTPMTVQGAAMLRDELQKLKTVERPRIIIAIAEARSHGDLKENAEYHAAREQQSFTEGRILEIEEKLSTSQVIDVTKIDKTDKVVFGTTVTLINVKSKNSVTYKIVGDDESDINLKKISVSSPIARSMIGRYIDDVIEVNTPDGSIEYEIIDVEYI
ncbi:transcription elongation factor GreA [Gammaproteobacteria bacterium]|nr:transcription elongation factor GreA [Gammaproteobacteria bacterium]